jgi:uncharacterized phage protein gp47/JayE
MTGVTTEGFQRKTISELTSDVKGELREKISRLLILTEKTPLGNVVEIFNGKLGLAWEAIENVYHSLDPDGAVGDAMVSLAALTGTNRKLATRSSVPVTLTFDAAVSYAAGDLIAHEDGSPTNRWYNLNPVSTAAAGSVNVTFVAETKGSGISVASGDLSKIAEAVPNWVSVVNTADSTPGNDLETIEALRVRRRQELAKAGSTSVDAIAAAVSALEGVVDVLAEENVTASVDSNGIPPHQWQITVWDGDPSAVADADIGKAINAERAAGSISYGPTSVDFTNDAGRLVRECFRRATESALTIVADIESSTGVAIADVKEAIQAAWVPVIADGAGQGDVPYLKLAAAPFNVDGVDNVTSFTIDGGTSDISVARYYIATIDPGDITVTGDVS